VAMVRGLLRTIIPMSEFKLNRFIDGVEIRGIGPFLVLERQSAGPNPLSESKNGRCMTPRYGDFRHPSAFNNWCGIAATLAAVGRFARDVAHAPVRVGS
jgi:hypothetical protein